MVGHQEHALNDHHQQQQQQQHDRPLDQHQTHHFSNSYGSRDCDRGGAPFAQENDNFDMTRRCSSLGVTLLTEYGSSSHRESSGLQRESNSFGNEAGADASQRAEMPRTQQGQVFMAGMSGDPTDEPPYRPMVGGGTAAAYNALRFDFCRQQKQKAEKQKRRMSSLSMGSAKAPSGGRFYNNNSSSNHNSTSRRGGASLEE